MYTYLYDVDDVDDVYPCVDEARVPFQTQLMLRYRWPSFLTSTARAVLRLSDRSLFFVYVLR